MYTYCFLNSEILPFSKAQLNLNDLALLRGYGVFEYFRAYNGFPHFIDQHINRFLHSSNIYRLKLSFSKSELTQIVLNLLEKNKAENVGIRFILTGGYSTDSFTTSTPNFFILIEDLPQFEPVWYEEGVKLMMHNYQREFPEAKSINYLSAIGLTDKRREVNAFDILYHHNDSVLEVTKSNFLVFKDDILVTPKDNILKGVTRNEILKLAAPHFKIEERELKMHELQDISEAFLSSTTKKILPVVRIDNILINYGLPGKNTIKLMHLFEQHINNLEGIAAKS